MAQQGWKTIILMLRNGCVMKFFGRLSSFQFWSSSGITFLFSITQTWFFSSFIALQCRIDFFNFWWRSLSHRVIVSIDMQMACWQQPTQKKRKKNLAILPIPSSVMHYLGAPICNLMFSARMTRAGCFSSFIHMHMAVRVLLRTLWGRSLRARASQLIPQQVGPSSAAATRPLN